jgi:hypothetical protein
MNVKLTERDYKIFYLLNRLKYMTPSQLGSYFDVPVKSIYDRAEKLVNAKYLESVKILGLLNQRVYINGINIRKNETMTSYKRKVFINYWTLNHHLKINDVYIRFVKKLQYEEEKITTEREMYWKKTGLAIKGKSFKLKMPDMVIEKDKKLIAIEVEESRKNIKLFRNVLKNYTLYTKYYCVRYICATKGIKEHVMKIAKEDRRTFIKAFTYEEFLKDVDVIGF